MQWQCAQHCLVLLLSGALQPGVALVSPHAPLEAGGQLIVKKDRLKADQQGTPPVANGTSNSQQSTATSSQQSTAASSQQSGAYSQQSSIALQGKGSAAWSLPIPPCDEGGPCVPATRDLNFWSSAGGRENSLEVKDLHRPFSLELLLSERNPVCAWNHQFGPLEVAYLAVARAGTGSIANALNSNYPGSKVAHCHDCTMKDLEFRGARRVIVPLRHPLERISSGVSRRLEGHDSFLWKNHHFNEVFHGVNATNDYLDALRDPTHPQHRDAMGTTVGPGRQSYMLPATHFYLNDRLGSAEIAFICTHNLTESFNEVARRWGLEVPMTAHAHKSFVSSSDPKVKEARFSETNAKWVRTVYKSDVELYTEHCGDVYSLEI